MKLALLGTLLVLAACALPREHRHHRQSIEQALIEAIEEAEHEQDQ